jgi:Tol biopolymer transport system component
MSSMEPERWWRIEQLFHAALEREESQRAAFLAAACQGDEGLRREVESLLARQKQAENFMETPAVEVAAKALAQERIRLGPSSEEGSQIIGRQLQNTMVLPAGKRLGPYEILAPLAAGGMGEVYRARDPRLGREVAVKVLPSVFSADPERLRRFEQESRAAGALNHPNVVAIYDVGTDDGSPYLVSELLVGETLRGQLWAGPLPLRKAMDYAVQIAHGLAAAHAKGIAHRDLKPDNIFVCKDGRVKILDFGLAKLIDPEPPDQDATSAPTVSGGTRSGMLLGTIGYMSPEQVRGRLIDHRTDIFSFGVILYEMLSGRRAFHRETPADTASSILKEDPPDLLTLKPNLPTSLVRLVRRCLEKNPDERFQSASDLAFSLESLTALSEPTAAPGATGAGGQQQAGSREIRFSRWLPYTLAGLLAVNVGVGVWWVRARAGKAAPTRTVQFQRLTDFTGLEEFPAISPDGKSVAFSADASGNRQIWVRLIAGGAPLQVTHDAAEQLFPRWSQDSASIIHYSPPAGGETQGSLWEVSALGGAPRRLASSLSGADLSHDGTKLAFFRLNSGQVELVVSDRNGSSPRVINRVSSQFSSMYPRWSPDDRWIAYEHSSGIWSDDIYVVSASGGEPRQVTHDDTLMSGLAWLPDGSGIIYSSTRSNTVLYLRTMHLWLAGLSGAEPQQLTYGEAAYENPDVDRSSRIVASRRRMQFDIWKYPVDGSGLDNVRNGVRITRQTGQVQTPTVGPGDQELAYLSDSGGHGNVWVLRLASGEMRQITYEHDPQVTIGVPVWSPDGSNIAFASTRTIGSRRVNGYWLVQPDGSNLRNVIKQGAWATWSPDGHWIYYALGSPTRASEGSQLLKMPAEGGPSILIRTDNAIAPSVAPDGSALYYVVPLQQVNGVLDYEIRVARPENGPSQLLARIPGVRVPIWQGLQPVISHHGKWLALPLNDTFGTNIWLLSTSDGKLRRVTDFGQRRTFIARRLSWSSDDRFIYAALGEGDSDIALLEGLLR